MHWTKYLWLNAKLLNKTTIDHHNVLACTTPLCNIIGGSWCISNSIAPLDSVTPWKICGEGVASARHIGQLGWENSHISIHATWKECKHSGKVRKSSPSSNSDRHTGQVPSSPTNSISFWYLCVGMSWTMELSMLLVISAISDRKNCGLCGFWRSRRLLHHPTAMQW